MTFYLHTVLSFLHRDMTCRPRASAAVLDNGFNMVTCLKVRVPNGLKYLVYDPQATGSGPTKYAISTSTTDTANFMARAITNTPTEGAHRLDFAWFIELQHREKIPQYARAHPNQQFSSYSGPGSIPFIPPESVEDIEFQAALSRALKLSLQDVGRMNARSARPSVNRPRRYQFDRPSGLPDVIPSEQEQLDRITESYIAEICEATRPSVSNEESELDDAGSPTNFECGVCLENYSENSIIRIPGCRHVFCKDCVQRSVITGLESNRFPILCPMCAAAPGPAKKSSVYLCYSFTSFSTSIYRH